MNKILASLLLATTIFLGCNIPYLQVSKKNADKFCSCYEDAAKHAYDMDLWLEKHYDRMDNESNQKKWAELEVDFGEFMEEAEDCYTDFTREKRGLYKDREEEYSLINELCPEVAYNIGYYTDFDFRYYPKMETACDCINAASEVDLYDSTAVAEFEEAYGERCEALVEDTAADFSECAEAAAEFGYGDLEEPAL